MSKKDAFLGDVEAPEEPKTPEQIAFEKRQKIKADKHEKATRDLTTLSKAHPEAYRIVREYIENEMTVMSHHVSNAVDQELLFKYSGATRTLREMLEKLDLYQDF